MFAKKRVFSALASLASSLDVSISFVRAEISEFTSSDILAKAKDINSTDASSVDAPSPFFANACIFFISSRIKLLASPSSLSARKDIF